jgi:hypothetical protein
MFLDYKMHDLLSFRGIVKRYDQDALLAVFKARTKYVQLVSYRLKGLRLSPTEQPDSVSQHMNNALRNFQYSF